MQCTIYKTIVYNSIIKYCREINKSVKEELALKPQKILLNEPLEGHFEKSNSFCPPYSRRSAKCYFSGASEPAQFAFDHLNFCAGALMDCELSGEQQK